MTTAVIDASVAVKWFVNEALSNHAAAALALYDDRHAPRLLLAELGNALWKQARASRISKKQAIRALTKATGDDYVTFAYDEDLAAEACRIAIDIDHPIYDCFYLALAQSLDAPLVTADARLLGRAPAVADIEIIDLGSVTPISRGST